MRTHLAWQRGLLFLLAAGLLLWVAATVSVTDALAALRQLSPVELLLLLAVNALIFLSFTARWWIFLRALGHRVPYLRLVGYRLTAFGISYFTPGPHFGGEPYQVYAVARHQRVPTPDAIAAVTLDKLLEMLINFAVLVAGALLLLVSRGGLDPWLERQLILYALLLLALPVSLLIALWQGRQPLRGLLRKLGRGWADSPWGQALVQSERQAAWLCRTHPMAVAWATATTLLSWAAMAAEFWLVTQWLGLGLTPLQAATALVAARIAILLPMPAGLGALEASQALAMSSLGLDPAYGVAIALLIRGRDVLLGLSGLALGGARVWQHASPHDPLAPQPVPPP